MTRILTIIAIMFITPAWANVSSDKSEGIPSSVEVNIRIFKKGQSEVNILLIEGNNVLETKKGNKIFKTQMVPNITQLWFSSGSSKPLAFELSEHKSKKAYLIMLTGFKNGDDGIYQVDANKFKKLKNHRRFDRDAKRTLKPSNNASVEAPAYATAVFQDFKQGSDLGEFVQKWDDKIRKAREEYERRLAEEREQKLLREKEERARQFARMREGCEEYGFEPKTDGLAGCVQRLHSAVLQAEAQQAAAEQRDRLAAKQLEAMDANAKAARWNAILNTVIQAGVSSYNTSRQISNNNLNTSRIINNDNYRELNRNR